MYLSVGKCYRSQGISDCTGCVLSGKLRLRETRELVQAQDHSADVMGM